MSLPLEYEGGGDGGCRNTAHEEQPALSQLSHLGDPMPLHISTRDLAEQHGLILGLSVNQKGFERVSAARERSGPSCGGPVF